MVYVVLDVTVTVWFIMPAALPEFVIVITPPETDPVEAGS
jgi:hypothetical protein